MLARMTSRQFHEWMAFFEIEHERADQRRSMVDGGKEKPKPKTPKEKANVFKSWFAHRIKKKDG